MELKVRWVGLNKHFQEIQTQDAITIESAKLGYTLTFFAQSNRGKDGNCKFISEDLFTGLKCSKGADLYNGDIIAQNCKIDEEERICHTVICWDKKNAQWAIDMSFEKDGSDLHSLASELEEYECWKVGNRYENADLLQM